MGNFSEGLHHNKLDDRLDVVQYWLASICTCTSPIVTIYVLILIVSDGLRKLFTVIKFSNKGTSSRVKEETAFSYFVDYLDACEGGNKLYAFRKIIIYVTVHIIQICSCCYC